MVEPMLEGTCIPRGSRSCSLRRADCQIGYSNGVFAPQTREGYAMGAHPVVNVTWYGAVAFCNWLSEKEGLRPCYDLSTWSLANRVSGGYRLPTEAEWERAAAWDGSKHWIYGFSGDRLSGKDRCNYWEGNPDGVNPLGLTSYPYTSPVGWFDGVSVNPNGNLHTIHSRSPVGCYDMSGGVLEWCEDWWQDDFYETPGAVQANALCGDSSSGYRVLRGGYWGDIARWTRAASRKMSPPHGRVGGDIGFRVARSSAEDILEIQLPGLPADARPLRLVRIPAGAFLMGSTDTERGHESHEGPLHQVTIAYDFYMGETEITQAQWQAIMGSNPASDHGVGNDYPVYNVSWNDITQANGFLANLNALGQGTFHLPSEAEWEYACRAGTTTRFNFGDSLACADVCEDCTAGTLAGNRSDYLWFCGNPNLVESKPVHGSFPIILDYMTCTGVCGNGARIGTIPITMERRRMGVHGFLSKTATHTGCSVAVPGTTAPGVAVQRFGTTTVRLPGAAASVSVSPGLSNAIYFYPITLCTGVLLLSCEPKRTDFPQPSSPPRSGIQ